MAKFSFYMIGSLKAQYSSKSYKSTISSKLLN